jgi:dTDP-4-amino-4,6-dideoxygalactose transaminase
VTSLQVPFVALDVQQRTLKPQLMAAFERVLDSGQYILGRDVADFEERFAALCGTSHAVGIASGTCALILGLRALGIGAGDEVITAPNSFLASAASVALVGARPVFVDVRHDLNIDPDRVEDGITPQTRAIIPVHLTGRPAAMDRIGAIAARRRLFVIEDAAQAVGARLDDRPVGSFGALGCFSLHPLKNLGACGDAGVVTTNDVTLADALRAGRNHGLRGRDACDAWSYNCRLDAIQAAILNVKLERLAEWNAAKRRVAARYRAELADVVGVPDERPGEHSVYQTFIIRAARRDDLQRHLAARGVDTRVHYPTPLHLQQAASDLGYKAGAFPVTEQLATEILSLPIYPELTDDQQSAVIAGVRSFYGRAR